MQIARNGTAWSLHGPEDAPVIALIHGLGLTHRTWQWHLPALARDYRVLNYDLFGHGESAAPPKELDLTVFAGQLRDLMDELSIQRAALVGFSLGGMINRRFALDYPERTLALGILNSPHERGAEAQRLVEARAMDSAAGGPGANLDETINRWFTGAFQQNQPEIIADIRRWVLANDPDHYAAARRVLAFGVTELIRPQIPIHCPALVITAENDSGSTPAMSHAIAAEIPGAGTLIVPRLQHMALVEDPDAFTAPLLEFLNGALR